MKDTRDREELIDEIYQMMPHNKRGMNVSGVRQVAWEGRFGGHRVATLDNLSYDKLTKLQIKLLKYLTRQERKKSPTA